MTKISSGSVLGYVGEVNGNVYQVTKNGKVWEWATYDGIGGPAVLSGVSLTSAKAVEQAKEALK